MFHGPDFAAATPFIKKAFRTYIDTYCACGRGGAFIKRPDLQLKRAEKRNQTSPKVSKVMDSLALKPSGIHLFKNEEFLNNLKIKL